MCFLVLSLNNIMLCKCFLVTLQLIIHLTMGSKEVEDTSEAIPVSASDKSSITE